MALGSCVMKLDEGRSNSGIELLEDDKGLFVERRYLPERLDLTEDEFRLHVRCAADVGLVHGAAGWEWSNVEDFVLVRNPYVALLEEDDGEEWACYEALLERAKQLHLHHGLFIGDAHSKNVCLAKIEGRPQFLIVDGKVGGLTHDADVAWRRLRVKRRYEMKRYHRWFLDAYLSYIDDIWTRDCQQ